MTEKRRIEKALGRVPGNVRWIEIDFNKDDLETEMQRAGYRSQATTLFVWEGETNYLTAEAVDSTLSWCSKAASQNQLVFTYIDKKVLTSPESFYGTKRIVKALLGVGERWTFGVDPIELASYLKKRGLKLESDVGAAQYRMLYFKEASLKMKGYKFYRVATASI